MRLLLRHLKDIFPKSFLNEFMETFGEESTDRLLDIFSGTTIEIPSSKNLESAERDIIIYTRLSPLIAKYDVIQMVQDLAKRFKLTKEQVKSIYKGMKKHMKSSRKFQEASERVSQIKKSRVVIKRRTRRRL
jgi:Mor family transcriptional regulator